MAQKKKSHHQKHRARKWWLVPAGVLAVACLVFVLTQVPLRTNENNEKKPIIELPLEQKVSAATLQQRSKEFQASLHNVPFIISTSLTEKGPQYDACSTGMMGLQPGDKYTTYVFMSKDSSAEAFYRVKTAADGTVLSKVSYYNPSASQLSNVIDGVIGRPFVLDDPSHYYIEVSKNHDTLDGSGRYNKMKYNSKDVYVVYAAVRDGSLRCGNDELVTKFIIDALTGALIATEQYRGLFDQPDRLVYRYSETVTTEQLDEQQVLAQMSAAGFDKATAPSEFPAQLPY